MTLRWTILAMSLTCISLTCTGLSASAQSAPADDPLLRPIEPDYAKRWLAPQPPVRIFGDSYLVGFGGLSVGLIRTKAGLILIDGAVPQAVPRVEENIRALGFALRDVKYILSTEPHYDHAGGLAALARDTGATVLAGPAAVKILRAGGRDPQDAQNPLLATFPAPTRIRAMRHGETLRLGDVTITAIATPGHTPGSTSWRWRSCEETLCVPVMFAASLNPVSADGYRFTDPAHAAKIADFRRGFARIRAQPCGILLTSHPEQSDGDAKFARLFKARRPNPFILQTACRTYADKYEALLNARLVRENSDRK